METIARFFKITTCFIFFMVFLFFCRGDASTESDKVSLLKAQLNTVLDDEKPKILNDIGMLYLDKAPRDSITYCEESLNIAKPNNMQKEMARSFFIIGIAYLNLSEYDKALSNHLNAFQIREKIGEKHDIANSLHYIGIVYDYLNNYNSALEYHEHALATRKEINDKKGIADSYHNIGTIKHLSGKYSEALEYYLNGLKIREEIGDAEGVGKSNNNIGFLFMDIVNYPKALDHFLNALETFKTINDQYEITSVLNNIGNLYIKLKEYDHAREYLDQGLKMSHQIEGKSLIQENYLLHSDLYFALEDYQQSLEYFKMAQKIKESIFNAEMGSKVTAIQVQLETEKKQRMIELLKKDNEIKRLDLERQKILSYAFLSGFTLVLALAATIFYMYRIKKKSHAKLEEAHRIIKIEKEKSDKLLLNILPVRVAEDLKERGKTEPESFEHVTVFFSDLVGFTRLSAKLDPKFLIDELNILYTAFDNIVELNACERIKTIGDAYLCVCGMPTENPDHANNIVRSAIQMIQFLKKRNQEPQLKWQIRIGIHSGRVVGGVVGIKKYIYDVFGDTINTASRMESNSEAMKINVSETTYQLIKDKYPCTPREEIPIKGKGNMRMYFVDF